MKKIFILFVMTAMLFMCSTALYSFEIGLIGGRLTKPSHNLYGVSGGMGMFVPMLKLEVEIYRLSGVDYFEYPNGVTIGIKFRPKLGKFSPYAVIGIGADFDTLGFQLDEYEKFTFIGGGVHFHVAGMLSLRGDVRFLNYTGYNRTRLTAGVFIHF
jgi:hypothetical protein